METTPYVQWTSEQQEQLEKACRHHPKPHVREKCSALLKLAQGQTAQTIAEEALLTRHAQDTLTDWVKRFQQQGLEGLQVRSGRGRKPAFSPSLARQAGGKIASGTDAAPASASLGSDG